MPVVGGGGPAGGAAVEDEGGGGGTRGGALVRGAGDSEEVGSRHKQMDNPTRWATLGRLEGVNERDRRWVRQSNDKVERERRWVNEREDG
ncbi:hypothetical protein Tsubulata_015471 [Turnera subulata]|uniref:Uncharacterized protein n=1 Tax=Turnera subulata TaxID=218843 RepID=A0A9Q0GGQ7_9ROSI|nr:hypothetical protein Tsubulata_015471 [Turnera subulata]